MTAIDRPVGLVERPSPEVSGHQPPPPGGRPEAPGFLRRNALAIACFTLFFVFWASQAVTGWHVFNEDSLTHGQEAVGFGSYLTSGHFIEATAENWQSEFLAVGSIVVLTIFLRQKRSPESKPVYVSHGQTGE